MRGEKTLHCGLPYYSFFPCVITFRVSAWLTEGPTVGRKERKGGLSCSCCWDGPCPLSALEASSGSNGKSGFSELPHLLSYKGNTLTWTRLSFTDATHPGSMGILCLCALWLGTGQQRTGRPVLHVISSDHTHAPLSQGLRLKSTAQRSNQQFQHGDLRASDQAETLLGIKVCDAKATHLWGQPCLELKTFW